jgi:uncharacterized protein
VNLCANGVCWRDGAIHRRAQDLRAGSGTNCIQKMSTLSVNCLDFKQNNEMHPIIEHRKQELKSICENLNIKRLYVFGSVVTGDAFNDDSDLDFLLAFDNSLSPIEYSENYFELLRRLKDLFNREVDIVTERSLSNPYFIDSVNKSKVEVYEAGNFAKNVVQEI